MVSKQKIYSQKASALNEADRLAIAALLIKAGYAVRLGREKPADKKNSAYVYFVEYWEENSNE
jgi:hypothetical protein